MDDESNWKQKIVIYDVFRRLGKSHMVCFVGLLWVVSYMRGRTINAEVVLCLWGS